MQAACKTKQLKQESVAKGASNIVHVLFIPAAAAEGGTLCQGYLWQLFYGVNTQYGMVFTH